MTKEHLVHATDDHFPTDHGGDDQQFLARHHARRVNDYDVARDADDHYEPINLYNAPGAPETVSARNRTPMFGRGGRKRRRAGGKAQGELANGRADRPRRMVSGYSGPPRSPYSQGHWLESPSGSRSHRGHEGDGPAMGHEGFDDG
jgi:hypothetical protein